MQNDESYEASLIEQLNQIEKTREWLEKELREVRNRIERNKNDNVIDWSTGRPRFNSIGEWTK